MFVLNILYYYEEVLVFDITLHVFCAERVVDDENEV